MYLRRSWYQLQTVTRVHRIKAALLGLIAKFEKSLRNIVGRPRRMHLADGDNEFPPPGENTQSAMTELNDHDNQPKSKLKKRLSRKKIAGLGLLTAIFAASGAAYWWFFEHNRVSTDDAYARADSAQVSSRVSGTIQRVLVDNDDFVNAGQTLVELDPAVYTAAVQKAQARLAQAEADVGAKEASVSQTDLQTAAQIQAAEAALKAAYDKRLATKHQLSELDSKRAAALAEFTLAEKDFRRFEQLFRSGSVAAQRRDEARTKFKQTQADLDAVAAQISSENATLEGIQQEINVAEAQLKSARADLYKNDVLHYQLASLKAQRDEYQAELDTAKLSLSYCTIAAPIAGFVAQKSIQVGDRVQPGLALMAIVPLQQIYVEANFKETDLTDVRVGQPAVIEADIYPDYVYHGKVVGIRAGTGAAFSLLPPENATGNWIKIVQRVPVKIAFDAPPPPEYPLRVGLSLEVTVNTSDRSGSALRPEDAGATLKSEE
jgi:membrane fusion protein (multidrug efflux system)